MNKDIQSKIIKLRENLDEADMFLGPPAIGENMRSLESKCLDELGETLPTQYLEFLRLYDGLISSGVFIYSSIPHKFVDSNGYSHSFLDQNLAARDLNFMSDYLIFGESDMDIYVLDITSKTYQVRDRQAVDSIFEEFKSFDELLEFMIDLIISRA